MSTEAAPQPPVIPDYELLRLIGRGAYGEVWLARGVTGVHRAVKLVWRDRFPEAGPYEREFHGLKEFAAISLTESRQLALLHVGRDPAAAYFYYVMELADDVTTGRNIDPANYTPHTLKEMRVRRGRLPAGECVALGVELARALSGLHGRGLVHRDIKPSNVIIVGGAPKLADIGLVTEASAALTFVGTEGFVPPEGPGAPGADVFALGKLLYELVTGLDRHDYPRLPPELHAWPDRKEVLELNEVLIRACEPHPDRRHPDAAALLDDLLLLQAGKSVRRLRKAERRLARALKIATVLALIAGVAGLGAYLERQRANQEMAGRLAAEAERDALAERSLYASTIGNAQIAIQQGDFGKARQLLGEVQVRPGAPDPRGFEWHLLAQAARGDPARILQEGGPAILKLARSPDGRLLAVHDADRRIMLRDAASFGELRLVSGINAFAGFSGDSAWLLGLDNRGRPQRWRTEDGTAPGPAGPRSIARLLGQQATDRLVGLIEGRPAELVVWDFAAGREILSVKFELPPEGLRWDYFRGHTSADGTRVALAWVQGRGSAARFHLTHVDLGGTEPRIHHATAVARPAAVGFDGRGAWAVQAEDGMVWRFDEGGPGWRLTVEKSIKDVRKITAAGPDQRIAFDRGQLYWLDDSGRIKRTGRGHQGIIGDVLADPATGSVLSGSHSGELRLWSSETAAPSHQARQIWNSHGGSTRLVFSADSRQLAVPADGQSVQVLDCASLRPVLTVPGLRYPVWFDRDRMLGLPAGAGGFLQTSLDGAALQPGLPGAVGPIHLLVNREGNRWCLNDSSGKLWWEEAGRPAAQPVADSGFENRFSLRGNAALTRLWTSANDNLLRGLSLPDARELWQAKLPALAPALSLSPDEKWLAVPLESGRVQVRDAATGTLRRTVTVGGSTPQDALFSPDGTRLFVAGSRGDIACLETTGWSQVVLLRLPTEDPLHHLAISPDGRTLAAVTKTGALHLLRTRP